MRIGRALVLVMWLAAAGVAYAQEAYRPPRTPDGNPTCHEGNYSLVNILRGERVAEEWAAKAPAKRKTQ